MIRLASATISSALLFSKLEGLSGKGRLEPGGKVDALQPLPTRLISIRWGDWVTRAIRRRGEPTF
jgi:hypothetical protein